LKTIPHDLTIESIKNIHFLTTKKNILGFRFSSYVFTFKQRLPQQYLPRLVGRVYMQLLCAGAKC